MEVAPKFCVKSSKHALNSYFCKVRCANVFTALRDATVMRALRNGKIFIVTIAEARVAAAWRAPQRNQLWALWWLERLGAGRSAVAMLSRGGVVAVSCTVLLCSGARQQCSLPGQRDFTGDQVLAIPPPLQQHTIAYLTKRKYWQCTAPST